MPRDSATHTFKVAILLCLGCSVLVSGAAVLLRPRQEDNKQREVRKNILQAAGLFEEGTDVEQVFSERVRTVIVDLSSGEPLAEDEVPADFDQRAAAKDPDLSVPIENDLAGIGRRETLAAVYLVASEDGSLDQIVLPVYGKGLWSTLYGFLSLDVETLAEGPEHARIRGLTFYEHAETPGLGGEVDNPRWKAKWSNPDRPKRPFDSDWDVQIEVIKGEVSPEDPAADHKVDGLAGATITTRGVSDLLNYWLGDDGFGPFLQRQRAQLPSLAESPANGGDDG